MRFSSGLRVTLAVLSAALGMAAAVLPDNWIEQRFGFSPDGGNGVLEFLWVAAPLTLAAILVFSLVRDYRTSTNR
jgi:uncharacterized membrane protein YdbT with pleckstrin-like domain